MSDAFAQGPEFTLEPPAQMTLDTAIQRALKANLDSRIAFEHSIQAKYAVTAAYLNLIPHLTTNLIWNADPGYISAIATLQGLAPFLLPTYWLQAKETQYDAKIKSDAEIILKSDLAAMVEQLSYAYTRDQSILWVQDRTIESLDRFTLHIAELERSGGLPYGSADLLRSVVEKVQSDREKTQQLVQEDQYVVSQALGFHNPIAVTGISVPAYNPSNPLEPLSRNEIAQIASHRSFELRQMSYLKKIARLKKTELYFAWVDPTGDPKSSFGFNTIPQLKLADSQQRELDIKREQLQQTIYQNCYRIVDQYNATVAYMEAWPTHSRVMQQDLDSLLSKSIEGGFQPEQVNALVENYLSSKIGFLANVTAHRIAKSKIDRVLLAGYYKFLLPQLDQIDSENLLP